jgi:hypothetical protein
MTRARLERLNRPGEAINTDRDSLSAPTVRGRKEPLL